jgi:uncharacterized protein (DUF1330 family)
MKTRFTIAASMLAGAALGGAAIQALHAQAKPPVYMIAINEVSNQEGYAKEYVSPAQKSVKDHGGEYVAAGPGTQVAGNLPHGPVVILRWDSMEALQAWHNYSVSRCVTVEDEVASLDDLVAGKAGVVHRLAGGFAAVKLSEPPAAGRGVFS